MTQCIGSPAQDLAERYLVGELSGAEAESFENHYFGCELCHEYLVNLKDIREVLAREPAAVGVTDSGQAFRPGAHRWRFGGKLLAFPVPVAVLGSIAATLIAGVALVAIQQSTHVFGDRETGVATASVSAPAAPAKGGQGNADPGGESNPEKAGREAASELDSELAQLADLRLPGYRQPLLRGGEAADLEFSAGMLAYTQGDCRGALEHLSKVPARATERVAASLYAGLCQLQGHALDRAQASFAAVAAAGDSPQLETAEYFLAQTRLLRGDAEGAADWLAKTIALHGDYEERAQNQKARLPHGRHGTH